MSSIIEGYNYDIFISYRQKDNKGDRWVSEFVEALKTELESTFKEEISVYFDINPYDGLQETHDVNESLKKKLKCVIFIPIISRTYCDPKSFAWEHEFKAFVEQASQDPFGLKVKLPNGNVAYRILQIRINDLDNSDTKLCESILGGVLRGVEFIYKEPGVNRPLRSNEDNPHNNLNHTFYRNQVNKVALAVKDLIESMKVPGILDTDVKPTTKSKKQNIVKTPKKEDKLTIDEIIESTISYGYTLKKIVGQSINTSNSFSENTFNQGIQKLNLNENLAEQIAFSQLLIKNDIIHITFKRSDNILNMMNGL